MTAQSHADFWQSHRREVDALARQLREKALSGYAWNVAKTWEDAHEMAKNAYRGQAIAVLIGRAE